MNESIPKSYYHDPFSVSAEKAARESILNWPGGHRDPFIQAAPERDFVAITIF